MKSATPPPPVTSGASPASGPLSGGTPVTISGSNFSGASVVLFGAVGQNDLSSVTDTSIQTTSPAASTAGSVDIYVIASGQKSVLNSNCTFTYAEVPTVSSCLPRNGPNAGGTPVTLTGSGFTGATQVLFGGAAATAFTVVDDTTINATTPPGSGTVNIVVTTPEGGSSASVGALQFMYATIPLSITVSQSDAVQIFYVSMYGTLYGSYTNSFGTVMQSGTNVCLMALNGQNGPYDYVPTGVLYTQSTPAGSSNYVPPFLTGLQAIRNTVIDLPNVAVSSQRAVIGLGVRLRPKQLGAWWVAKVAPASNGQVLGGTGFQITLTSAMVWPQAGSLYIQCATGVTAVAYTGVNYETSTFTGCTGGVGTLQTGDQVMASTLPTPVINASTGTVAPITPQGQGNSIYDFFEFTYQPVPLPSGPLVLTINTSSIDQYGLTTVLEVEGAAVAPTDQVGVMLSRAQMIGASGGDGAFATYVAGTPFASLCQDAFGNPTTVRILSPKSQLNYNPVYGLFASAGAGGGGNSLPNGTYYYSVTAVENGAQAYAPDSLLQFASTTGGVNLAWGPPTVPVDYFNVYRGQWNGTAVAWSLLGTSKATSYADTGAPGTTGTPPAAPLATYFDGAIAAMFADGAPAYSLTVTDGTSNGYQYTFTGTAMAAPAWLQAATGSTAQVIQFECSSIANMPSGASPPIPVGSTFFVFSPFFNTNTLVADNPNPPNWNGTQMDFASTSPTGMALGANGVFADNAQQSQALWNNSNQPQGLTQAAYQVAVGALEDDLNSALLRGVALTMPSANWANSPPNIVATQGQGSGSLDKSQTYYYVVTTINALGESTAGNEASSLPGSGGSIALSWAPLGGAKSYNIYRGTASGAETQLIATVSGTTFSDTQLQYDPMLASPPTSGSMTVPSVSGATAVAGGSLAVGTTYDYVVTALGATGESLASNQVSASTSAGLQSVMLTWQPIANVAACKIYRSVSGGPTSLVGVVPGNPTSFTDTGSAAQTPPPYMYYAPGSTSDLYAQFFHLTTVSYEGLSYAAPFDDQGNQSSTISAVSPQSIAVTFR